MPYRLATPQRINGVSDGTRTHGLQGHNGLFVAMPSRKTPTGEFRDIAHPINSECRELIQNAILQHYESAASEADES